MDVRVVLLESTRLGRAGEIVHVSSGYARNYLIPQGLAQIATQNVLQLVERERQALEQREKDLEAKAQKLAKSMKGRFVAFIRQCSEDGRLFGSVTPKDIAQKINAELISDIGDKLINSRQIFLLTPIKSTGRFNAEIALYHDISVSVDVLVGRTHEEALSYVTQNEDKKSVEGEVRNEA
ncbi:50S ribosomal protein L9 [Rickettsiales endosymbiont of Paramecium tredecaurelia]|uniref:50S ribosomal protein L9 n=1 Tax=Candidatus Sarmatiella mevalonica TaxID=2770581 RepID=UPI001924847A|nr:50S ribosomal protein L9 [Candidatus Sarmatiella mevalonica]MBL3284638.1 50S ribosomal protein L9 [Candidatus Sarmatiella mevalonica]